MAYVRGVLCLFVGGALFLNLVVESVENLLNEPLVVLGQYLLLCRVLVLLWRLFDRSHPPLLSHLRCLLVLLRLDLYFCDLRRLRVQILPVGHPEASARHVVVGGVLV